MKSFLLRIFDFWTLVHTRDPLRRRKGYLLAVTLGIFLASLIILTIANVISYLQEPTSEVVNFLWMDAIDIVFFAALWWLNRAGRIRLASYLFLVFVITFITVGFPADTFNRVLLAYAIPILTASFLIEPASAFPAVLFSIMGYTLRYFYDGKIYSYNTLSLLALIMVAMVALTAARQLDRALEASTLQQVKLAESQAHLRIVF